MENDVYVNNGYKDRDDYLESLASEFNTTTDVIFALSDLLGESEDFDGLVSSLQDFEYEGYFLNK